MDKKMSEYVVRQPGADLLGRSVGTDPSPPSVVPGTLAWP